MFHPRQLAHMVQDRDLLASVDQPNFEEFEKYMDLYERVSLLECLAQVPEQTVYQIFKILTVDDAENVTLKFKNINEGLEIFFYSLQYQL